MCVCVHNLGSVLDVLACMYSLSTQPKPAKGPEPDDSVPHLPRPCYSGWVVVVVVVGGWVGGGGGAFSTMESWMHPALVEEELYVLLKLVAMASHACKNRQSDRLL